MSLLTSLALYLDLGESSGNAIDSAGGGLDFTENGTVSQVAGPGTKNARRIDGVSALEWFERAASAGIDVGDFDFTYNGWFYLETERAVSTVLFRKNTTVMTLLHVPGTDKITFSDTVTTVTSTGTVATGAWYMLTWAYDSVNDLMQLQIDAGTADTAAQATGFSTNSGTNQIGSNGVVQASTLDGRVAMLGFWTRLLSGAEVTSLYNGGAGRSYSELSGAAGPLVGGGLVGGRRLVGGVLVS